MLTKNKENGKNRDRGNQYDGDYTNNDKTEQVKINMNYKGICQNREQRKE